MPVSPRHRQCQKRGNKQARNSSKVFWNKLKPRKRSDLLTCLTWSLRDKLKRSFKDPEDVIGRFSEGFAKGVTVKVGTWVMEIAKITPDPKGVSLLIRVQGGAPHQYRCPVARLSMKTGRQTDRAQERETDQLIRSLLYR